MRKTFNHILRVSQPTIFETNCAKPKYMGVMYCPNHGRSGFQEMCQHVDDEFKSGNYREFRLLYFWHLLICDNCWNTYNFDRFESHPEIKGKELWDIEDETPIFQEYHQAYSNLPRRAWCTKCLNELIEKSNISNEKPNN